MHANGFQCAGIFGINIITEKNSDMVLLSHAASIASFDAEDRDEPTMGLNLVRRVGCVLAVHGDISTCILWGQAKGLDLHVADLNNAIENLSSQYICFFITHSFAIKNEMQ